MNIYQKDVRYEIVSDRGTVQVETVAGKPSPTDAHLMDNVKIYIRPVSADGLSQTTIYLEDLIYDSERSEYTTDGPIKIISENGRLEGTGMVLIYNNTLGRVEYLRIKDLDYLHLKDISTMSSSPDSAKGPQPASAQKVAKASPVSPPQKPPPVSVPAVKSETATVAASENAEDPEDDYYECRFERDVVITYGKQIVIEGAQDVTINNILLANEPADEASSDKNEVLTTSVPPKPSPKVVDGAASEPEEPVADSAPTETGAESTDEESEDILITCKGPMTVKPMTSIFGTNDETSSMDRTRTIELRGKSVHIRERAAPRDGDLVTIARCGRIKYDIDRDVMDMFTNDAQNIFLNMAGSESQLQTTGSVRWKRKADKATITGPGKLLMHPRKEQLSTHAAPSEMNFNNVMQVFFAQDRQADSPQALTLKSVNIAGGMAATMRQGDESHMSSESAAFFFDEAGDITLADLTGAVSFSSAEGRMDSSRAKILFAKDTTGGPHPVTMQSTGKATLIPAPAAPDERPARFKAKKIDYDMTTGNAFATGPVTFIFYVHDADETNPDAESEPVVITADDNAEFFKGENRVVFNGNVVGTRQTQKAAYSQKSTFHGDKLIVDLAETQTGSTDIRHVSVLGRQVMMESVRSTNDIVISHIRLSCKHIDYDAIEEVVTATGPGNIQINNENAPIPPQKEKADKTISLQKPCYALIEGFDKLRWFTRANRITADGKTRSVNISYLPITDGKRGSIVRAATTHITANFIETASGQNELATLLTTGGVTYREVGGHEFIGDTLFYETATSLMTVDGTDQVPCLLNGALVEKIKYDLATGDVKAELASKPGIFRSPPKRKKR
jgi:lipopolysaccharide export system protein LptA